MDAVLRRLLPLGAEPTPAAHQHLPDALAPQKVQAAARCKEGPPVLAADHHSMPAAVRALEMVHLAQLQPDGQDDRSRVTGDCHARICGSRGVRLPPATRLLTSACTISGRDQCGRLPAKCYSKW